MCADADSARRYAYKATDLLEQLQGLPTRIGRSGYFLLIEDEAREEEYMASGTYTWP